MKILRTSPATALAIIVLVLLAGYLLFERFFTYTSTAYVASNVVIVSPQVAGHIKSIEVERNQPVSAGELLMLIDPEPFELSLQAEQAAQSQAQANLRAATAKTALAQAQQDEAKARLDNAETQLQRTKTLLDQGDVSQQQYDNILRNFQVDKAAFEAAEQQVAFDLEMEALQQANLEEAQADVASAEFELQQTRLTTPIDGIVAPFSARPGAYVDIGTQLMAVVSSSNWRVVANVREQHAARLKPGMTVWFQLSTGGWRFHRGTIRSIAPGVSREENDTGVLPYVPLSVDWIRLSQRFPVEIDIGDLDTSTLLHGGDARVFAFH